MDLVSRVAREALLDAALVPGDVDGLLLSPTFTGAPLTIASMVADLLGVRPGYCDVVDLGGATATGMVWRAAAAIAAGACPARCSASSPKASTRSWECARPLGPRFPGRSGNGRTARSAPTRGNALAASRHAHEYGTTDRPAGEGRGRPAGRTPARTPHRCSRGPDHRRRRARFTARLRSACTPRDRHALLRRHRVRGRPRRTSPAPHPVPRSCSGASASRSPTRRSCPSPT